MISTGHLNGIKRYKKEQNKSSVLVCTFFDLILSVLAGVIQCCYVLKIRFCDLHSCNCHFNAYSPALQAQITRIENQITRILGE